MIEKISDWVRKLRCQEIINQAVARDGVMGRTDEFLSLLKTSELLTSNEKIDYLQRKDAYG